MPGGGSSGDGERTDFRSSWEAEPMELGNCTGKDRGARFVDRGRK